MPEENINTKDDKKKHRDRNSGRKAEKKKNKKPDISDPTDKQRNPKAFAFNSAVRAERRFRRKQDIDTKKQHVPLVDRTPIEPPPLLVAIVGPPKVGKSTLVNNLIKLFTRSPLTEVKGPVTIVTGKKRRITIIECNNDVNSMIDIAKVADLVLLLCDASFGFEMEMFEFLNICQVHGMPRIMGVLTHLDMINNTKTLKTTKKVLKHRFWTEVYAGAKLFYLSGIVHGEYLRNEIKNLGRFISVMKLRPLSWRTTHSYLLADRLEDLTSRDDIRKNPNCDRTISLYGYVRGIPLNNSSGAPVHIAGLGDLRITEISTLPDPCPAPGTEAKKRALIDKEKLVYAPFSGVGGIVYDKDAVYVELGGSHSHKEKDEPDDLVSQLIETQQTIDEKMKSSKMQIFSNSKEFASRDFKKNIVNVEKKTVVNDRVADAVDSDLEDELNELKHKMVDENGRLRRKVVFDQDDDEFIKNLPSSDEENDVDDEESELENDTNNSPMKNNNRKSLELKTSSKEKRKKLEVFEEGNMSTDDEDISDDEESDSGTKNTTKNNSKMCSNDKEISISKVCKEEFTSTEDEDESEEEKNNSESTNKIKDTKPKAFLENTFSDAESNDSDEENINRTSEYTVLKENKDKEVFNVVSDTLKILESKTSKKTDSVKKFEEDKTSAEDDSDSDYDRNETYIKSKQETVSDENAYDELKWKHNLAAKARDAFLERQSTTKNLMKLVYGVFDKNKLLKNESDESENDDNEIGNLFRVVTNEQQRKNEEKEKSNIMDSSLFETWKKTSRNWLEADNKLLIDDCFVTGKWKQSEDASELLKLDDMEVGSDNDSEIYGDFEDLETGERHVAKTKDNEQKSSEMSENTGEKRKRNDDELTRDELAEKKRKLKEKFDADYDNGGEKSTYYDDLKSFAEKQAQLNRQVFEDMPDDIRVQIEGFRSGMYVRMEFENVPAEFINYFDPTYPLIVGGLNMGEENIGFVNIKIKKHRWYQKILKTNDPLIISLGWRRFQTVPLFSKLEDDLKYRYLKYTPEHVQCNAHFWGPITPQGTGLLAVEPLNLGTIDRKRGFRIVATGSVQESDKSTNVMKKLKLIGYPYKIYKKTAFIKDMFSSSLEVAKFEGAKIKTVSGIRGQVKKGVSKPEGCFRATFEDKIQLSDIVFCRTWYKVDVNKFYCPITTLLLPPEKRFLWTGAKTAGQLRRESGIKRQVDSDNLYTEIVREPRPFKPLVVPRKLQKELPYRDRPKFEPLKYDRKPNIEKKRIAVVREPKEQKIANMLKMLRTSYQHKQETLQAQTKERLAKHHAQIEAEQLSKDKKLKMKKKDVFRARSKAQAKERR